LADTWGVMFVQWTEAEKQLVGQIQALYATSDQTIGTESRNRPFKGIRNGDSISLTFNDDTVLTGTLTNNELSLVFPDRSGNLNTMVLKPATVADYNTIASELRDEVHNYNVKEQEIKDQEKAMKARQQAIKDQQEAVTFANNKLSKEIAGLSNLSESLEKATTFDDVLKDYQTHWNEMQEHQKNMTALASKKPFDGSQLADVQLALTDVELSLTDIQLDNTSMEYRVNDISYSIKEVQGQMAAVKTAWDTLQNAVTGNTTGSPKAQFTPKVVEQAIVNAQKQIDRTAASLKTAQDQAKEYHRKANIITEDSKKFVEGLTATN